ncbi:MAG TPA: PAS domain S-box protein [Alphaproteobacteria bacterium]|nr:PAS domain S-box protein [Alphaproteobacteria bacterium]
MGRDSGATGGDETRFRRLVEAVIDYAIYMTDPQGIVASWNSGAERIEGYEREGILGTHFSRFYIPEDRDAGKPDEALRIARENGRFEDEGWRLRKDGSRFWASAVVDAIYDDGGEIVGFAHVTRDLTARHGEEEALERARDAIFHGQKMEVLGQLTGGIAHDFNNMLTVISNNLDLLTRKVSGDRERRLIEIARHAAVRCAKLTEQLLAFARRQPLHPEPHDVNHLIGGFEAVLRRACGEMIDVSIALDPALRLASVDAQQFESALLNLAVNARDAMPQGGTLRITTRNVEIDQARAAAMAEPTAPGPYIAIAVDDTGHGMTADVLAHAIEPYFTTKEVGQGSGLGLSQVYGFVTQSGGHLDLASKPRRGTTVTLYLPAALVETAAGEGPRSAPLTVLAVEDDPDVLEATVETLRSLGYCVLTAGDGMGALDILRRDTRIDILFTDVVMPKGMNGIELAREACRLRSGLRVLLASGYPMGALSANHGLDGEFVFIAKPYRWPELAERLRALMEK